MNGPRVFSPMNPQGTGPLCHDGYGVVSQFKIQFHGARSHDIDLIKHQGCRILRLSQGALVRDIATKRNNGLSMSANKANAERDAKGSHNKWQPGASARAPVG